MGVSRRQFFHRVGLAGGYGATYSAMHALGLETAQAATAPPDLPAGAGKSARVVILGAGIAGLVLAYELERSGFDVTVIEARDRVGGRNWTIRGGTRIEMAGEDDQIASFSDGQYFNAGPARLPSHHQGVLGYCRRLGVALEVEVNASRSAFLAPTDTPAIQMRQAINDTRGHISELLTKAIDKGALDQDLTADDKARLRPFLKAYGDLTDQYLFKGSERSGYVSPPGAGVDTGTLRDPLALKALLDNDQLGQILFEDRFDMQATMFQPVGGMDSFPHALARAVRSPVMRHAEVTNIRSTTSGVAVAWRDRKSGKPNRLEADYALVTLPLVVLAGIDTDFEAPVKQAIAAVAYDHSNKVAFEAPRFWEREQVYGGISWVGGETTMVWYPSAAMHSERGVLVATYTSGAPAEQMAKRPLAEQISMARAVVGRLHPGHEGVLERPVAVNWSKVPYNFGPWPRWGGLGSAIDTPGFRLLNEPHGRVYFTGAHLSQMPGWQEGAVLSAHRTIALLAERVTQTAVAA